MKQMNYSTPQTGSQSLYSDPRHIENLDGLHFYHTIELPKIGVVSGDWDLRSQSDAYLGGIDLKNKRVLDIGPASGFLTFEMEKRGAEVVSYDLAADDEWDAVPFSGVNYDSVQDMMRSHLRAVNGAYWLSHRLLESRARLVQGTIYNIPTEIGPVDVALFGAVLLHVRDPFRALHSGLRLTRETVIVTDMLPGRYRYLRFLGDRFGLPMFFMPRAKQNATFETWWIIAPATICEMLRVLGFGDFRISYHRQLFRGSLRNLYTIVGRRTGPAAPRISGDAVPKAFSN